MSLELGRRLIASGLVSPEEVEAALFLSVVRGMPFARALLDRGALTERALEAELDRVGGLAMRQVTGAVEVVKRLPRALCRRLAALPTRVDPATGAIDVAAADPLDPHVAAEIGFHLGAPIRVIRAPIAAVEEAIRRLELDDAPAARVRERRVTPPFPHGAPQSTIPPPIAEEAPIPLVRKVSSMHLEAIDPGKAVRGGTLVPPSGAPPVSYGAVAPPTVPVPSSPIVAVDAGRGGARRGRLGSGVVTIPTPEEEPPSVSFPSMPPEPLGAPIHGSRVVAVGDGAHDGVEVYRIAPPADDALPMRPAKRGEDPEARAEVADQPPPSVARRASRPSIPPVRYPGPAPSAPPTRPAPSGPESERGELRRRRVRPPDGTATFDALRAATNRDEVVRLALRGMRLTARRLAVFAVRKSGFHGWACNVELGDEQALKEVYIPADLPSVLATATATAVYLGPIPATPAHDGLLRVMERSSPDVAAVAVRVAGRAVLVLLCDDLDDTLVSTRFLGELSKAVGDALTRLISR